MVWDSIHLYQLWTVSLGYMAHPKLGHTPLMWSFDPDHFSLLVGSSSIIWFNGGTALMPCT